jgi:hypothetical protein
VASASITSIFAFTSRECSFKEGENSQRLCSGTAEQLAAEIAALTSLRGQFMAQKGLHEKFIPLIAEGCRRIAEADASSQPGISDTSVLRRGDQCTSVNRSAEPGWREQERRCPDKGTCGDSA